MVEGGDGEKEEGWRRAKRARRCAGARKHRGRREGREAGGGRHQIALICYINDYLFHDFELNFRVIYPKKFTLKNREENPNLP